METEGSGADTGGEPLLRAHVEAYCDAIAEGMKVNLLLFILLQANFLYQEAESRRGGML